MSIDKLIKPHLLLILDILMDISLHCPIKNSISHIAKFDADLVLDKFRNSDFFTDTKVSNDTYLKVFDGNLLEVSSS